MSNVSSSKGAKGENCNRTACQAPKSAHYYNIGTRAYYCIVCARRIRESGLRHREPYDLFPSFNKTREIQRRLRTEMRHGRKREENKA